MNIALPTLSISHSQLFKLWLEKNRNSIKEWVFKYPSRNALLTCQLIIKCHNFFQDIELESQYFDFFSILKTCSLWPIKNLHLLTSQFYRLTLCIFYRRLKAKNGNLFIGYLPFSIWLQTMKNFLDILNITSAKRTLHVTIVHIKVKS